MSWSKGVIGEVRMKIDQAQRILTLSHLRPDGDAVGSLIGFGLAMRSLGKQVEMVLSDGAPQIYKFLSGHDQIRAKADGSFDFIVVLDCSDRKRAGPALNAYPKPDLNIDHHQTNENFARYNLVNVEAVATAEIVTDLLEVWDIPMDQAIANALLTGIVTDTLGFRTSNVTPQTLRRAADLMAAGGELTDLYYRTLTQNSLSGARFWGIGLTKLQCDQGIIWTSLSQEDRRLVNYPGRDDADLINILSTIEGVEIAVIFLEQSGGRVKISWRLCGRAESDLDVSQAALLFGGGGHKAAAGAEVQGTLSDIQAIVLDATRALINGRENRN